MFRSIRWRLVASYVLLTLLTVSLIGVLALSLIKRYVGQQELDYLTANGEAVARQALPLMRPVARPADLHELARTASFLGNIQVRILNDHRRVLADSGQPTKVDELVWIVTPIEVRIQSLDTPFGASIMVLPASGPSAVGISHSQGEALDVLEHLPPGTEFTVVHREEGLWGSRFIFGGRQRLDATRTSPVTATLSLQDTLEGHAALRSERVVTVPIGQVDRPIGYVELSKGPDLSTEALTTARRAFLLAAGGATLLAVIVGLLVSRGLTAPLHSLTAAADQMSGGDLSIRAPARGKDEIGQLARQFNQMAERLESSFTELAAERDSLRRFIADASHELRTPVTALRNFNELLQGAAADDPAARAEFLAESQVQLDRLEWITHNLLDLSRLEAGLIALDVTRHDAEELIRTAAAAFRTLAHEKDVTLSVQEPSSPLAVHCDRARIELALSNLLDNALKFTPAGGQVEIGAEPAAQNVRLWVQDSGPGIAPADREHIFERFYRGRDSHAEGIGLGLAIVRSIVQAHGGHVTVEGEPGAGSRFVIQLPTAGPAGN
jgi:two-component system OmpR family sensor kinase